MEFTLKGAAYSHVGKVRSNNEDNFLLFGRYRHDTTVNIAQEEAVIPMQTSLAAVCDGMGGESAGEIASKIAVETLYACGIKDLPAQAARQLQLANAKVCAEIKKHNGIRMGSTVAALYIDNNTAVCANLGDSRVYLLREGHLRQLSTDHSEAQRMVNMGILSRERARQKAGNHRLTQHLGIFPDEFVIEPYVSEKIPLQEKDVFLLCSDGLTDMLIDAEIETVLNRTADPGAAAKALVNRALENGGKDNVTVVLVEVGTPKGASEKPAQHNTKNKKEAKLAIIIKVILSLLAIICIALFGVVLYQDHCYKSALEMIETGKYKQALEYLQAAPPNDAMRELTDQLKQYLQAKTLLEEGKYEDARELFLALDTFGDSFSKAEACGALIEQANAAEEAQMADMYKEAMQAAIAGDLQVARDLFLSLADFKDSKEQAAYCLKMLQQENDAGATADSNDHDATEPGNGSENE